jgi:hypothetical protein
MAEKTTATGKSIEQYIRDVLGRAETSGAAAIAAGYPAETDFTKAYYAGIPSLYMYGDPEQMQALQRAGDLYGAYGAAGGYDKTQFGDIGEAYRAAGAYDPAQFQMADYTAQKIQQRMSPYEELVADRQRARLKKAYDEARGEREAQAIRQGAFGGSGQAIQDELARRNYLEQMSDMDAASLQAAFESGAGLYSKEIADRLAAQQAGEQSRQFGKDTELAGLAGLMTARQQEAAQTAAAKEAQFAGLSGQQEAARQQALMAEQRKNMQITNLAASQAAGQQQEERALAKAQYPLGIAQLQGNVLGSIQGSTGEVPLSTQKTSTAQNILGGLSTAGGIIQGLGGLSGIASGAKAIGSAFGFGGAGGGLVPNGLVPYGYYYRGGGLADLEPEYYSYER